jgi:hypothetical protein
VKRVAANKSRADTDAREYTPFYFVGVIKKIMFYDDWSSVAPDTSILTHNILMNAVCLRTVPTTSNEMP